MQLGDIPLKHLRAGIRLLSQRGIVGTLKWQSKFHWYVEWDNGNKSILGDISNGDKNAEFYKLEIITQDNKIVIDDNWLFYNTDVFSYAKAKTEPVG